MLFVNNVTPTVLHIYLLIKFWSIIVSDFWNRYPNGILVGTTHQMGIYEECINVHQPIQGKYCILSVIDYRIN